jgi:dTDP-4-dehydrorhamnose reductase
VDAACAAAEEAQRVGSRFVFFSSDYVFDGTKAPYSESDPVRPLNEYGKQKVEAEAGIARACPEHLILRISGLFGWELRRKNFVLQVLDRLTSGSDLSAAEDIRYHPTYAPNLSEVTAQLLEKGCRGVYHAVGADEHSRHGFARLIAEVFGLDNSKIRGVRQAELKLPAPRPANSSLSTRKLAGAVGAPLWGARQALEHMRDTRTDWEAYAASLGTLGPCA